MRWLPGLLALACASIGAAISLQYPLAQPWAPVSYAACMVLFGLWPGTWLLVLPAVLPIVGFAPWTGWLTFEEIDLLVLAIAAAGYARLAIAVPTTKSAESPAEQSTALFASDTLGLPAILAALFLISVLIAMARGFADAGGFSFGWFQGYHEAMNSVRLAKSFAEALLLLPLWRVHCRMDPLRARDLLSTGLMLGLAATSLATIWERLAFTGLLNFSSDYRTTGRFWEMHVGGAALDGYLALTVPFAARELLAARSITRGALNALVCALAAYACLTTFSRGVYLAVPAGLVVFFVLQTRQRGVATGTQAKWRAPVANWRELVPPLLLVAGYAAGAAWLFQSSGYRGAGALLGVMLLLLPLAGLLRTLGLGQWMAGLGLGLVLCAIAGAAATLVPKSVYVSFALAFGLTAGLLWASLRQACDSRVAGPLALAGFLGTALSVLLVARHWGSERAVGPATAVIAACLLVTVAAGTTRRPVWPVSPRWQAGVATLMGLALAVVAIFGGGAYMGGRLSSSGIDLDARLAHWRNGVDMLSTPADWWLGKGLGRFPSNHFLAGNPKERPGDYRITQSDSSSYLRLSGGSHANGWSEMLRVTQRVAAIASPARAGAQVRTAMDIHLFMEVCEKNLLYSERCLGRNVPVKAAPGVWQSIDVELEGAPLTRGLWFAPRLYAFSVAMDTRSGVADMGRLTLAGPDGNNVLSNGDFSGHMAHWFFSSDKYHMPWHMKNAFMHVLFDQGVLGLALWSLLVGTALAHLTVGKSSSHALAPALCAGVVGFILVGMFDSLLDAPRLAMLFYLLVLVSLTLGSGVHRRVGREPAPGTRADPYQHPPQVRPASASRSWRIGQTALLAACAGLVAMGTGWLLAYSAGISPTDVGRATPAEWIRHAKEGLAAHDLLAAVLARPLDLLQASIERPPPEVTLPTLGKGQQAQPLPAQQFTPTGEPIPAGLSPAAQPAASPVLSVGSVAELVRAMAEAKAGQVIEMAAGRYRLTESISTGPRGTRDNPITLRAATPGAAVIEVDTTQAFRVTQPFWIFENMSIRGVCRNDADCDHAFHISGKASSVVLRNNRLEDFNAHVKVNGENGRWPDHGLMQFNTLSNRRPRQTQTPVTPFDLVAASGWQVADNLISDFVNAGGNRVSYGVFMKGAGKQGRIERNVIVCTTKQISQPGSRVGLSWGGGGTQAESCRDKTCLEEHTGGLTANNVVAHCNDAGIDANRSTDTTVAHNTLINTAGIVVRGQSERVRIYGNLLEGRVRSKDGAELTQAMNEVVALNSVLVDPDRLQLDRHTPEPAAIAAIAQVGTDFCLQARGSHTWTGATRNGQLPCTSRRAEPR